MTLLRQGQLVGLVSPLRWLVPLILLLVGSASLAVELLLPQASFLLAVALSLVALLAAAFTWQVLTWAHRAASTEAQRLQATRDHSRTLESLNQEIRRRSAYYEMASLLGQRMAALQELNPLLAEMVRVIRQVFQFDHVHVFLVNEPTRELILQESCGERSEQLQARGLRLGLGREGIPGSVAQSGQTIVCNDVSREPLYYRVDLLSATQAELAVPLRIGSRIIGVLDVQCNHRDAFDKGDVTILQIIGNQLGAAIENTRLFEETKRRYDAMVALHEMSLDMISELDHAALLQALLRRGTALLDAEAASLFLYDSARQLVSNVANHNTWRDWTGVTLRPGEGVSGQVIVTGEPLIVNNYQEWAHRVSVFAESPHSAVMGAPLKWRDEVLGSLIVMKAAAAPPFTGPDLWLLTLFADLAAVAIKNAELHAQVIAFGRGLEHAVAEKTRELAAAKEDIAAKAEQLRRLLGKTIHLQEEERARIAREMHDGVFQLVTAARYELQAGRYAIDAEAADRARDKLNAVREVLDEIEQEIRHAINDLYPPSLDAVDLVPALSKHARSFNALTGINCQVQTSGVPTVLPMATEVAVFRMVEEALHNVATHAGARNAFVRLDFSDHNLVVSVEDDGRGFDYDRWQTTRHYDHLGLVGMQERIRRLGGTLRIQSQVGQGTCLTFAIAIPGTGVNPHDSGPDH